MFSLILYYSFVDLWNLCSRPALPEAVWVQDQHQEELRLPIQLWGNTMFQLWGNMFPAKWFVKLVCYRQSTKPKYIWTIFDWEWPTTSAPTLDQKMVLLGAQLRWSHQLSTNLCAKNLQYCCNPLEFKIKYVPHCSPISTMTILTRLTPPTGRLWGTHGRTARRAAPAPTLSATRASSSTLRESASTEPRLLGFSAGLVIFVQSKMKILWKMNERIWFRR